MQERQRLEAAIEGYRSLSTELQDCRDLIELGEEEGDQETVADAEAQILKLQAQAAKKQLESLLSGEADPNDAFIEINAGAGGTEAQDWAGMLLRLYSRWANAHGYSLDVLEESAGEEAGIKSTTLQIKGENAFGWLKTETGVHRLVRISPFDSQNRRHTSFASVWVSPVVDDSIEVDILDKDLRVDTYRASGAGGQHVNRTDSAVRITHEPTGIVVQCQNDRSQHKNRATAMNMLKAKLYELELRKRQDAAQAVNDEKSDIAWGTRSAPTCSSPTRWSKTCAPAWKPRRPAPCSTVKLICSSKPHWRRNWAVTKRTNGPLAGASFSPSINQPQPSARMSAATRCASACAAGSAAEEGQR